MKEGIVLVLDEREMINAKSDIMALYTRSDVYRADVVICGNKVLKNKWGKHGTIGEPYLEQHIEHTHQIVLDIWDKVMQREKEIGEVKR